MEHWPVIATLLRFGLLLPALAAVGSSADDRLVARYTFDEGKGTVLTNHGDKGHTGTIHGAEWLSSAGGRCLAFKTAGSHVDCGTDLGRRLTGDMTLVAWVRLAPRTYPDASTNWTVADCEDYTRSGFILRVDGQTSKLYYRASSAGRTPDGFTRAAILKDVWHQVGVSRAGNRVTLFLDGLPDTSFTADPPLPPTRPLTISSSGQWFQGMIAGLEFYGRSLSRDEVLGRYKAAAAGYGKDTSRFGKLQIEPFFYLDRGKATVALDCFGVLPLPTGASIAVELGKPGGPAIQAFHPTTLNESGKQDFTFPVAGLSAGDYQIRAILRDAHGRAITEKAIPFRNPPEPVRVPVPAEKQAPPLPASPKLLPFDLAIGPHGEFSLRANGREFPLVSQFSYPGGGFNQLGQPAGPDQRSEASWQPAVERLSATRYRVTAAARCYELARSIEVQPSRVIVRDTLTNRTGEALGILVRNRLDWLPGGLPELYVAGYRSGGPVIARPIKTNPTLFLAGRAMGLGLVAMDDVFIVQSLATAEGHSASIHTDTFALDKGASYTLEWAVYPTVSGDYYDFINQFRRDEGRNGRVDGGLGFITRGPADRRGVPSREFVQQRNLKYGIIHCLSYTADDPGVSIEGIEFLEFPKERQALKEQMAAIRAAHPGMKVAFHVAHSLYATNQPDKVFSDSRVIDVGGRHAVYTTTPGAYFSKQRLSEGWNWYIYYPTLDNSFGRAMLDSVDVMMDDIGADGPFMDGFMWAYGGEYTFDRWDGHTAAIDPKTKTITRKMGSVLLLSQDALVAFCRKVRAKGGVVIANNSVITRTIAREGYLLLDRECFAGPEVHLAPTPLVLSLPSAIRSEVDVHRDVLDKLAWGNLYIYYQEGALSHPSVPAAMYPITFDEIRAGCVKGADRLITSRTGVYGWHADRDLHLVRLFDGRGVEVPHRFFTTADSTAVRTQVDLAEGQCAVVRKLPLGIQSAGPVNLHVSRYDARACELIVSGRGPATLTIRSGDFPVRPGGRYVAGCNGAETPWAPATSESLSLPLELAGEARISIQQK